MKEVLILVPTHPTRYKRLHEFIGSYNENELYFSSDLCFVMSNKGDDKIFHDKIGKYNTLILPDGIVHSSGKGIINIKKLFGVKVKANEYKYIIVMDDDALFCKKVDLFKVCETYFQKKVLISSFSNGKSKIALDAAHACKRFFRNYQGKSKIENIDLLWFNQPCIYKSDTIDDFFNKTGIDEWLGELTDLDFDYLIYMYYLILFCGFTVVSCGLRGDMSIAELTSNKDVELLDNSYENLIYYCATEYMQKFLPNTNIFITWHVDRESNVHGGVRWFVKACFFKISVILKNIGEKI